MAIGEVGYHNGEMRKIIKDIYKDNSILNILKKSKKEEFPDLQELKE